MAHEAASPFAVPAGSRPDSLTPTAAAPRPGRRTALPAVLLLAAVLAACGEGQGQGANGPGGMFGGPVPVAVAEARAEAIPVNMEYTAQTAGSREVEVRARVIGILEKRNYVEGAQVAAGQSLFTIDPAPFQAALARAEADLAAATARHEQARRNAARLTPLIESKAVSQKEFDDAVSAESIAAADVQAAQARLREARLNLEYTRVEAPIRGVTSRALRSEGSLVSGPDVLLTTVTQTDPIHVIFGISDNEQMRLNRDVADGKLTLPKDGRFQVVVRFADGSEFKREGRMDFRDVRVNPDTGTSEARAELPNPGGVLRPGQFVRVMLKGATRTAAFKLPQRAVLEGPQGKFVYVVGAENKAEMRPVQVAEWNGGEIVVTDGLKAGEQVIVDGVLKLGPGAPVQVGAPPAPQAPLAAAGGTPAAGSPAAGDAKATPDTSASAKQ